MEYIELRIEEIGKEIDRLYDLMDDYNRNQIEREIEELEERRYNLIQRMK